MNNIDENNNNNNNNNIILSDLQKYMLNEDNIKKLLLLKNNNETPIEFDKKEINKKEIDKKENSKLFIPREKDMLFWCFYVMKNGDFSYEILNNRNFILEKKIKFEYIDKIRNEKQLIKSYKISTLTHIENELANESKIDISTFLSLCIIENINVIYVHKKTYYELLMNDTNTLYIIYSLDNYKFGVKLDINNDSEKIKNTLYKIENIDKPIRSITYYKISDLTTICNKLSITTLNESTNKNKNKKELYESLIQYF